jgi:uncharacterized membrane protein
MTKNNLKEMIKLLGRKMYLAYLSIHFLALFSVTTLLLYLFFPEKLKDATTFITTVVGAFTSIILGAIGANYLISRTNSYGNQDSTTQDLTSLKTEEELLNEEGNLQAFKRSNTGNSNLMIPDNPDN